MIDIDLGALATMDEVLGSKLETADLIAEFLDNADEWTAAVASQTEPGSLTPGHRAAHTLATSAATMGAHALGKAAREIEHALAAGEVPDEKRRRRLAVLLDEVRTTWAAAGRWIP